MFRRRAKHDEFPGLLEVVQSDGSVTAAGLIASVGKDGKCRVRMGRPEEALAQEISKRRSE
jgi:hypothetical protein